MRGFCFPFIPLPMTQPRSADRDYTPEDAKGRQRCRCGAIDTTTLHPALRPAGPCLTEGCASPGRRDSAIHISQRALSVSIRDGSSTTPICSQNTEQSHESTSGDLCKHALPVKRTPTNRVCSIALTAELVNKPPAALQSTVQQPRSILGYGTTTVFGPANTGTLDPTETTLL
jgi:hypothetical protein